MGWVVLPFIPTAERVDLIAAAEAAAIAIPDPTAIAETPAVSQATPIASERVDLIAPAQVAAIAATNICIAIEVVIDIHVDVAATPTTAPTPTATPRSTHGQTYAK